MNNQKKYTVAGEDDNNTKTNNIVTQIKDFQNKLSCYEDNLNVLIEKSIYENSTFKNIAALIIFLASLFFPIFILVRSVVQYV